jgi:hypothetical protein
VYVTNAGDITIKIVLNRGDVSRQDRRIHASKALVVKQYDSKIFTYWFKLSG